MQEIAKDARCHKKVAFFNTFVIESNMDAVVGVHLVVALPFTSYVLES